MDNRRGFDIESIAMGRYLRDAQKYLSRARYGRGEDIETPAELARSGDFRMVLRAALRRPWCHADGDTVTLVAVRVATNSGDGDA